MSVVTTTAAAPSLMPEELPAVTVPPSRNAARSLPSASMLVSRGCSSVSKVTVSRPFFHVERQDLLFEAPGIDRLTGALLRALAELVLDLARHFVLFRQVLGGHAIATRSKDQ